MPSKSWWRRKKSHLLRCSIFSDPLDILYVCFRSWKNTTPCIWTLVASGAAKGG